MDCQTARLLLPFLRPGGHDLDAEDLAAVQAHLAGCPACQAVTGAQQRFDALVGKAMLAVSPPVELRHRIFLRLTADRHRFWYRRLANATAAAAVVLGVVLGTYGIKQLLKPEISITELSHEFGDRVGASPEDVAAYFRGNHLPFAAPPDFDFGQLLNYGPGTLKKRSVPALLFVHYRPDRSAALAEVYVLHESEFQVKGLALGQIDRDDASDRSVFVLRSEQAPAFAFVIVIYNGQLEEFQKKPPVGPEA